MNKQLRQYYNTICQKAIKDVRAFGLVAEIQDFMSNKDEQQVRSTILMLSSVTDNWLCFYLVINKNGQFGINPNFYITMDVLLEEILTNPIWQPFLDAGTFGGMISKAFENTKIVDVKDQLEDPKSAESMAVRLLSAMVPIPQLGIEVGQYEVTNGLYYQVSKHKKTSSDPIISAMNDWSIYRKTISMPVVKVTWYDCILWCNAFSVLQGLQPVYEITYKPDPSELGANYTLRGLNKLLGETGDIDTVSWNKGANGYRLLTSKEWADCEKANTRYRYAGSDNIDEVAWYNYNSNNQMHGVGQKKPNNFDLYDMSGNVKEWVWDSFSITHRVIHGGSFNELNSYQKIGSNNIVRATEQFDVLGFRICRNIS